MREETAEVARAINGDGDPSEELGDLLFAVVNVARFLKTDPEDAINRTTDKFIRRFAQVEQAAKDAGRSLSEMSLAEMDALGRCQAEGARMNKAEFIAQVAQRSGMTKKDAEKAADAVFETIAAVLETGDKLNLPGFGALRTHPSAAYLPQYPHRCTDRGRRGQSAGV